MSELGIEGCGVADPQGAAGGPQTVGKTLRSALRQSGAGNLPLATATTSAASAESPGMPVLYMPLPGAREIAAENDPLLTATGRAALLAAFLEAIPPDSPALHRETFKECYEIVAEAGEETTSIDPRWPAFYRHPLVEATTLWIGATMIIGFGGDRFDRSFSSKYSLEGAYDRLEARFEGMLRDSLETFWTTVRDSPSTTNFFTIETLALEFALMLGHVFVEGEMATRIAPRDFLRQLLAMWRTIGIPGDENHPLELKNIDDFMIQEYWISIFWISVGFEFWYALTSGGGTVFDPYKEFPSVPFSFPTRVLNSIPAASKRGSNAPITPELLEKAPGFRCRDFFGWMESSQLGNKDECDVVDGLAPDLVPTDRVLAHAVGNQLEVGDPPLAYLIHRVSQNIVDFTTWLESTGLEMLELLVAAVVIEGSVPPPPEMQEVLANPDLPEAIRRRSFLMNVLEKIEGALPQEIRLAVLNHDAEGYRTVMADLALHPIQAQQLLGYLSMLRVSMMLLGSPKPFEDLLDRTTSASLARGSVPRSSPRTDTNSTNSTLLQSWFSSKGFIETSEHAHVISGIMGMLFSLFSPEEITSNFFVSIPCRSATYATWFHLLVINRFNWIVDPALAPDQARANELHDAIVADIRACFEFLDSSGIFAHRQSRALLQSILDGDRQYLTPREIKLLRMASEVVVICPHKSGGGDGHCWMCAVARLELRVEDATGIAEEGADTLGDVMRSRDSWGSGSPLLRSKSGSSPASPFKKVRFAEGVEVFETHAKEDYPGRSLHAPDSDDELPVKPRTFPKHSEEILSAMLQQRAEHLPNLRAFW